MIRVEEPNKEEICNACLDRNADVYDVVFGDPTRMFTTRLPLCHNCLDNLVNRAQKVLNGEEDYE